MPIVIKRTLPAEGPTPARAVYLQREDQDATWGLIQTAHRYASLAEAKRLATLDEGDAFVEVSE